MKLSNHTLDTFWQYLKKPFYSPDSDEELNTYLHKSLIKSLTGKYIKYIKIGMIIVTGVNGIVALVHWNPDGNEYDASVFKVAHRLSLITAIGVGAIHYNPSNIIYFIPILLGLVGVEFTNVTTVNNEYKPNEYASSAHSF